MILGMRYPGGKGKTYHHIINLIPPHKTYIETHLGGGAVLRNKKTCLDSFAIDRDARVIQYWRRHFPSLASYIETDAVDFLTTKNFRGDEVLYCDPPYLPSTRRQERVYRYDYTRNDHERLLEVLRSLPCKVLISGYPSRLYDRRLRGWSSRKFLSKSHSGVRVEKLWFNFDPPDRLHDSRYLGNSFRERQTFRRRIDRIRRRISSLSSQEQHFLSEWLADQLRGD
jgi:DNA adenine methylase